MQPGLDTSSHHRNDSLDEYDKVLDDDDLFLNKELFDLLHALDHEGADVNSAVVTSDITGKEGLDQNDEHDGAKTEQLCQAATPTPTPHSAHKVDPQMNNKIKPRTISKFNPKAFNRAKPYFQHMGRNDFFNVAARRQRELDQSRRSHGLKQKCPVYLDCPICTGRPCSSTTRCFSDFSDSDQ